MKFKKAIPHDILISPTPNGGYICTVGCLMLSYSDWPEMIRDLTEYVQHPIEVEKEYNQFIKPDQVHIGRVPDITVRDYMPGNTIQPQQGE